MNNSDRVNTKSRAELGPDSQLTIYYLDGRLPPRVDLAHPDFIGNWEENGSSFLFFTRPAPHTIDCLLTTHPQIKLLDAYRISYADWLGERPAPFRVGCFFITPPWETPCGGNDIGAADHRILLDPGVVFGTGTHPTTRRCLEAIALSFGSDPPRFTLDLGTGTGVLALAAASLGARKVLAVDINRLAVLTARKNIYLNRLQNRILAVQGKARDFVNRPVDLLVANIHYDALRQAMAAEGFFNCKRFILSGLLRSEVREVVHQLKKQSVDILRQWNQDGVWHTLYAESFEATRYRKHLNSAAFKQGKVNP